MVDELPEIPGVPSVGRDVVHCPYCHGYEVRDQGRVLATSPKAVHQALLFRQLSADVVVFANGVDFSDEQREQLLALAIGFVEGQVGELMVKDDRLVGVRLADGRTVPRQAVVVTTRMVARAAFLTDLGLTAVPHASGMGEHLVVDATGRTGVPGVWAAGNVTDLSGAGRRLRGPGRLGRRAAQHGPRHRGRQAGGRGLPGHTRRHLT